MNPSFPDPFVLLLLAQDPKTILAFRRLVDKVQSRTEQQLRETKGIHQEPIKSDPPYQSIRLDRGPRAKVRLQGDMMIFEDLDTEQQEFYGKK